MRTLDIKVAGQTRLGRVWPASAAGWALLLWGVCAALPLHASELDPLDITVVQKKGDRYFEPANLQIVVWQQPVTLFIRIRNTSSASRMVRANPERAYALELKDSAGTTIMVKRKKSSGGDGTDDVRVNLAAGADRIIPIDIDRDTWEGVPEIPAEKESRYTARVVYENADGRTVYSKFYTLIFRLQP